MSSSTSSPIHEYSLGVQKAIAIIPHVTGSISLISSMTVIYMILNDIKKLRKSIKERFLLILTIIDVFFSVASALSTLPVPKDTPGVWGARGNRVTCELQGFIFQFGLAVPCYNACLCVYFVLCIRYGMKDMQLKRRVEPLMHLGVLCWTILGAGIGLWLDLYNDDGSQLGCWIHEYPLGCTGKDCERGRHAFWWSLGLAGVPLLVCLVVISTCIHLLVLSVQQRERRCSQWAFQPGQNTSFLRKVFRPSSEEPDNVSHASSNRSNASKAAQKVLNEFRDDNAPLEPPVLPVSLPSHDPMVFTTNVDNPVFGDESASNNRNGETDLSPGLPPLRSSSRLDDDFRIQQGCYDQEEGKLEERSFYERYEEEDKEDSLVESEEQTSRLSQRELSFSSFSNSLSNRSFSDGGTFYRGHSNLTNNLHSERQHSPPQQQQQQQQQPCPYRDFSNSSLMTDSDAPLSSQDDSRGFSSTRSSEGDHAWNGINNGPSRPQQMWLNRVEECDEENHLSGQLSLDDQYNDAKIQSGSASFNQDLLIQREHSLENDSWILDDDHDNDDMMSPFEDYPEGRNAYRELDRELDRMFLHSDRTDDDFVRRCHRSHGTLTEEKPKKYAGVILSSIGMAVTFLRKAPSMGPKDPPKERRLSSISEKAMGLLQGRARRFSFEKDLDQQQRRPSEGLKKQRHSRRRFSENREWSTRRNDSMKDNAAESAGAFAAELGGFEGEKFGDEGAAERKRVSRDGSLLSLEHANAVLERGESPRRFDLDLEKPSISKLDYDDDVSTLDESATIGNHEKHLNGEPVDDEYEYQHYFTKLPNDDSEPSLDYTIERLKSSNEPKPLKRQDGSIMQADDSEGRKSSFRRPSLGETSKPPSRRRLSEFTLPSEGQTSIAGESHASHLSWEMSKNRCNRRISTDSSWLTMEDPRRYSLSSFTTNDLTPNSPKGRRSSSLRQESSHTVKHKNERDNEVSKPVFTGIGIVQRQDHEQQYKHNVKRRLSQTTRNTGIMYIGSFLLTYFFVTMEKLVSQIFGTKIAALALLSAIFLPLQGFWSFCIVLRPRYNSVRKSYPELFWLEIVWLAAFQYHLLDSGSSWMATSNKSFVSWNSRSTGDYSVARSRVGKPNRTRHSSLRHY